MQGSPDCEYIKEALALPLSPHNRPRHRQQGGLHKHSSALIQLHFSYSTRRQFQLKIHFPLNNLKHTFFCISPTIFNCSRPSPISFIHSLHRPPYKSTLAKKKSSRNQTLVAMSTSKAYPGDPKGTHAMSQNAVPRPIDLFGNYDCVNKSEYKCNEKVQKKGDKCSLCQVWITERLLRTSKGSFNLGDVNCADPIEGVAAHVGFQTSSASCRECSGRDQGGLAEWLSIRFLTVVILFRYLTTIERTNFKRAGELVALPLKTHTLLLLAFLFHLAYANDTLLVRYQPDTAP